MVGMRRRPKPAILNNPRVQEISNTSRGAEYGDPLRSQTLAGAERAMYIIYGEIREGSFPSPDVLNGWRGGRSWQPLAAPTKNPDEVSTFKFYPVIFS